MTNNEQTELLTEIVLLLQNIDDRLKEVLKIQRFSNRAYIEEAQDKILKGSKLRQQIVELSNGGNSVTDIAKQLRKSVQQISNNITLLQKAGLIEEVRKGKEKCYLRTR